MKDGAHIRSQKFAKGEEKGGAAPGRWEKRAEPIE